MCFERSLDRARATVVLVLVLVATPASAQQSPWATLELHRSCASLAYAVGLDPETPRARLLLEVIRAVHPTPPGLRPGADQARRRLEEWLAHADDAPVIPLVAGNGTATTDTPRTVPSPLTAERWTALLGRQLHPRGLAATVLSDRRAALLYYGLMGVDEETRAFLGRTPALLRVIYQRYAPVLAMFGRSLHVREGRMQLPGGPEAVPLWEAIVGERVTEPASFIQAALHRSQGRVAFFLDTVAHLDAPHQHFALAAAERDPGERLDRVRRVLRTFTEFHAEWRVADSPFTRPLLDAPLVLLTVQVTPEGRLGQPASQRFWECVFSGHPPAAADRTWVRVIQGGAVVDAAWLLEQVLGAGAATGRGRLGAVTFAQRLFRDASPDQLADVARIATAFIDARTSVVSMERLGARDVQSFRVAADTAARLASRGDVAERALAISGVQAGLVMLERFRSRGVLSQEVALDLAIKLLGSSADSGSGQGAAAVWLKDALLPAIRVELAEGAHGEYDLLAALAGRHPRSTTADGAPTPSRTRVTWEGIEYEVDIEGAELARLERVRGRQVGNRLGDALALAMDVRALGTASTIAVARSACQGITARTAGMERISWPAPGIGAPIAAPGDLVAGACAQVRALAGDGDVTKRTRAAVADLQRVSDAVLADTMVSLVYALHVGDPAGAIDLAPDIARRHDFGLVDRGDLLRLRPWALPEERLGAGIAWHVSGSLLGLEHGLGKLALRFLFGEDMASAPRINENERRTLALGLALLNPNALQDRERDAIVAALARGRARLSSPEAVKAELRSLAESAGWSEWRVATVGWAIEHDPGSMPSMLTLADYFWTGLSNPGGTSQLDAWGAATTPLDGDLRLAWPGARPWEELAGRSANGQLATRFVDMTLRVAETLAEHGLPASLTAGTLAPALADLIHEAPLGHEDDWYALAGYASRLSPERLLDYIASLAAGGPLVPAADGDQIRRPGQ